MQRKLEVKDFNIAEEAKGVGNVVIKTFPVEITDGKLEIRLYWAGKGTTVIPTEDVYGPLISAISVDPSKQCYLFFFGLFHIRVGSLSDI